MGEGVWTEKSWKLSYTSMRIVDALWKNMAYLFWISDSFIKCAVKCLGTEQS